MRQDFLETIERQLVQATERGVRRRRWLGLPLHLPAGPRLRFHLPAAAIVATAVTAVTATALAAELGLPVIRTRPTVSTPAASVQGSVLGAAHSFDPESFTAIGEFTWWLLGTRDCDVGLCVGVARTEDGGRSFSWIAAPTTDTRAVDQLRFANAQDGYAFGPELWSTHSGGADWRRVHMGGTVISLAASGPYVYALVAPEHGPGRLLRSPVGVDRFRQVASTGDAFSGLWVQGGSVLVGAQAGPKGENRLLISRDYGARFRAYEAPRGVICNFEEAPGGVIWEPCVTGMLSGVWRSTDGGESYAVATGGFRSRRRPFSSAAVFAAAGSQVAVMGYRQLYRTADGGRSYLRVPTPKGVQNWTYLGFTDATHGVALGRFGGGGVGRLYYTIDAGASYHYVPIDPS